MAVERDLPPGGVEPGEIDDGTVQGRRVRETTEDPVESTVRRRSSPDRVTPSLPPMAKPSRATYVPGRDGAPEARSYGVRAPGSSGAGTTGDERRRDARPAAAPSPLPDEDLVSRSLHKRRRRSMGLLVAVAAGILVVVLAAVVGVLLLTGNLG